MSQLILMLMLLSVPWAALVYGLEHLGKNPKVSRSYEALRHRLLTLFVALVPLAALLIGVLFSLGFFEAQSTPVLSAITGEIGQSLPQTASNTVSVLASTWRAVLAVSTHPATTGFLWVVYLVGLAFFAAKNTVMAWRLRTVLRTAQQVENTRLLGAIYRYAAVKPGGELPQILAVKADVSPFVVGVFKPRIVFSQKALNSLSPDQLSLIAAHELEHIRRNDVPVCMVMNAFGALYWFNPFFHQLCERAEAAMESACDAGALKHDPTAKKQYAAVLMSFHHRFLQAPAIGNAQFIKRTIRSEKMRIENIFSFNQGEKPSMLTQLPVSLAKLSLSSLAATALVGCAMAGAQTATTTGNSPAFVEPTHERAQESDREVALAELESGARDMMISAEARAEFELRAEALASRALENSEKFQEEVALLEANARANAAQFEANAQRLAENAARFAANAPALEANAAKLVQNAVRLEAKALVLEANMAKLAEEVARLGANAPALEANAAKLEESAARLADRAMVLEEQVAIMEAKAEVLEAQALAVEAAE